MNTINAFFVANEKDQAISPLYILGENTYGEHVVGINNEKEFLLKMEEEMQLAYESKRNYVVERCSSIDKIEEEYIPKHTAYLNSK